MFALMNPSRVATPSFTTGTSRWVTVATTTVGGGGPACSLREQAVRHVARMMSGVTHAVFIFMRSLSRRTRSLRKDDVSCLSMLAGHAFLAAAKSMFICLFMALSRCASVTPKPEPFDEEYRCHGQPWDQDDCDSSVASGLGVLLNLGVATKELSSPAKQVCAGEQIDDEDHSSGNS